MYLEFRSISDLNELIVKNLYKFPHNIDLIVGVPRSGMLPANLLALYLNKPFTDIDSFIDGRIYSSGERGKHISCTDYGNILIVDDSISSGNALEKAKQKLKPVEANFHIQYAAIIASAKGSKMVDYYCEIIDYPRVFQWNIFHHGIISHSCMDIDGVLCVDPPIDDDGENYINYITNAIPLYIPTIEIDTLVSCRLEKYRGITENWLAQHGVKYKKLIMLDFKSKEERLEWGKHGEYKGEVFKHSDTQLFIESSYKQAMEICRISNKPVFCTETFQMYNKNGQLKRKESDVRNHLHNLFLKLPASIQYRLRKLMGKS